MRSTLVTGFACVAATLVFTACGGSDDAPATTAATPAPAPSASPSPSPAPAPAASSTITGSAVKGPVSSATVTVKNAATGAVLASTTTSATGTYSLSVPFTGDVIVEVSGGTYVDEATGAAATVSTTAPMRAMVTANGGTVTGVVTPLTTLAYTYAFGTATSNVTTAGFNTSSTALAAQFKLTGVNLVNSVPVVTSGTTDPYGQVLRALSQYFKDNNVTLATYTTTPFTAAQWTAFTTTFNSAYKTANPAGTVTFSFDGTGVVVAGTGVGGGTGSCGVNVSGTIAASGFTVPLNINYCITGLAGSCSADNATLSTGVAGQGGLVGAANLKYTYSASCAAGATTITLK